MGGISVNVLDTDADVVSVPDVVVMDTGDAVASVVDVVTCVVLGGAVELDGQSPTTDAVAPKRSDLMKFMQYAKDPTVETLKQSFFLVLAALRAFDIFLQSAHVSAVMLTGPHSFKGLSF